MVSRPGLTAIRAELELLPARVEALSVQLSPRQLDLLASFCEQLADYNSHTNLVADAGIERVVVDHILDSLALVKLLAQFKDSKRPDQKFLRLIDIGCGAGFPGIVLAIALPYLELTLVDSVGKKIRFLQSFIESAGLDERVRALAQRAEELGHQRQYRAQYDAATARAVGSFDLAAELAFPFLNKGGALFAQKSLAQKEEATAQAERMLAKLGGILTGTTVLDANILGKERIVIVSEKRSETPSFYPRPWAQMKSKPLSTERSGPP